jgi:protein CWC15
MTTAERPTFDPARGKATQAAGTILHTRALPAHQKLKLRQKGQGGAADEQLSNAKTMKELLLENENEHLKKIGKEVFIDRKRIAGVEEQEDKTEQSESVEAKRRRILEENKDVDASSDDEANNENEDESESDSDESDDEDETAMLMKELEKIKKERAEEKRKQEENEQRVRIEAREKEIAYGNPLLNSSSSGFAIKRQWTDDVVFKNQAKTESSPSGFVNDLLRSDFHRKFIDKFIK